MKHAMICLLFVVVGLSISGLNAGPVYGRDSNQGRGFYIAAAATPETRHVSENTGGTDKVIVYGCDGTVWEGSTGVAKGQAELQGTWVGREVNRTGEWSVTFNESGAFEIKGPGDEWYKGRYACDSNQDPKLLNLFVKESGNPKYIGQTTLIIYKIDKNTLTWASNEPGVKTRPGSFTPEGGTKLLVVTKQQ